MENFKSGFVTIVGKANVGKSTLMNALIGEKIAIVSNKPQTTRNKITGILSRENMQIVFLDTPGIHNPKTKLGEYMSQSISEAMKGMDILIMVVEPGYITNKDYEIAESISSNKTHKLLVINKIDTVKKEKILAVIDTFKSYGFESIIPICALNADGIDALLEIIEKKLENGPKYFPDDMITDQPERQICAEIIREKALINLKEEVPHGIGVEIIQMKEMRSNLIQIDATIYCERDSHKAIIIGKKGTMIGTIGKDARQDIEQLLDTKVNLQLWVKVKDNWRNSSIELNNLGYSTKNL